MTLARIRALGAALTAPLLALAPAARAQTVVIGPGASALSVVRGGRFTVPVVADLTAAGGASLGSVGARLLWRPATARFVSASGGTAGGPAFNADTVAGELRFALANAAGITGTAVLVQAVFEAVGAAGDTMSLRLTVDEATRAGTFADLLPITTVTSAGFCVAYGVFGDLNTDTLINGFDALIQVTYAVGLPTVPYSVVNGDVDGDGVVNTRDALGVLSAAVGLATPGFRIGKLNSGSCNLSRATAIAIAPRGLTLAPGDALRLSATQRDSTSAVIGGQPPSWQSRDTLVARVDSSGRVTAVAGGATRIVAVAAPGVMDSTEVTVGAARHTWYVDPAIAAGNVIELGSSTYPFGSIQAAVNAAAADDTVRVAATSYTAGARITKGLVVIGDSGAAGFPRIRAAAGGPAFAVDSAAGTVKLSRFFLERSLSGVHAARSTAVYLDRVLTDNTTGPAILLYRVTNAWLSDIKVNVASGAGVAADTVAYLALTRVAIDGVGGSGEAHGSTVFVRGGDSVRADSGMWRGGQAWFERAGRVVLRGVAIDGIGSEVALWIAGSTATLARTMVANGAVELKDGATVSVDSATFAGAPIRAWGLTSFAMRGGLMNGGDSVLLRVGATPLVTVRNVEVTGALPASQWWLWGGPHAIRITRADSVVLDSLWVHDNDASGVFVDSTRAVAMYGGRFEDNHLNTAPDWHCTVCFGYLQRARVAQTVVDHGPASVLGWRLSGFYVWIGNTGARVQFDSTTILGGGAIEAYGLGRGSNDTVGLRGVRVGAGGGYRSGGIWLRSLGHLDVRGIEVDSVLPGQTGLYGYWLGTFEIRSSRFTHMGDAVYAQADSAFAAPNPGSGVFADNFLDCDTAVSLSYPIRVHAAPITITGNTQQGRCRLGIVGANSGTGAPQRTAVVTDNATGTPDGATSLSLQGAYVNAVVARNTATQLLVFGLGTGNTMDTVRIDSNTVRGAAITGAVRLMGTVNAASIRGNLVDSVGGTTTLGGIYASISGTGLRVVGNTVRRVFGSSTGSGAVLYTGVATGDTVRADSNVFVDSRVGIRIGNGALVGRWNYIARNDTGMIGVNYARMDSSVFQQNASGGARNLNASAAWDLANNYWGDARGPRCASGCDTASASVGDSVIGLANFTPFLTSAPINVPTGAPPALARALRLNTVAFAGSLRAGATRAVAPTRRATTTRAFVAPPPSLALPRSERQPPSPRDGTRPALPEVIQ